MGLESLRRIQRPMLFLLAIFLIVVWGLGAGSLRSCQRRRPTEVRLRLFDRDITDQEIWELASRWKQFQPGESLSEQKVVELMALLFEAERAGVAVSDGEVQEEMAVFSPLRQRQRVESVWVTFGTLQPFVTVAPADLEPYYRKHIRQYATPAEASAEGPMPERVRLQVSQDLRQDRARAWAKELLEKVRERAGVSREAFAPRGLGLAAAGVEPKERTSGQAVLEWSLTEFFAEDEADARRLAGQLHRASGFLKDSFAAKVGETSRVYQTTQGAFIFRVIERTPGYDAERQFVPWHQGWGRRQYTLLQQYALEDFLHSFACIRPSGEPLAFRMTSRQFMQTIREFLTVDRMRRLALGPLLLPADTLRQSVQRQDERIAVTELRFPASAFQAQVQVREEDVRSFYHRRKNLPVGGARVGYLQPPTARVEYVLIPYDELIVTEEMLRQTYGLYPHRFRRELPAATPGSPQGEMARPFEEVWPEVDRLARKDLSQRIAGDVRDQARINTRKDGRPRLAETIRKMNQEHRRLRRLGRVHRTVTVLGRLTGQPEAEILAGRDRREVLGWAFSPRLQVWRENPLWPEDKPAKSSDRRTEPGAIFTPVLTCPTGFFFFRVVESHSSRAPEFHELNPAQQADVRQDLVRFHATQKAEEAAGDYRKRILRRAFALMAKLVNQEPTETDLPSREQPFPGVDEGVALAKALAPLRDGELAGPLVLGRQAYLVLMSVTKETRGARWVRFDPATTALAWELSDDEAADLFARHPDPWRPLVDQIDQADVEFLSATFASLARTITISPKDIEAYHREHQDEFGGKELKDVAKEIRAKLAAERAPAAARERLESARKTILEQKDQADWRQIARDLALTHGGPTGPFDQENAARVPGIGQAEGFEKAVRATKKGEISPVLSGPEAACLFVVRATPQRDKYTRWEEFPEATKEKIRQAMVKSWQGQPARERLRQWRAWVVTRELQAAAEAMPLDLPLKKPAATGAAGPFEAQAEWSAGEALAQAVFAAKPDEWSGPVRIGDAFYLIRPKEAKPAAVATTESPKLPARRVDYVAVDTSLFLGEARGDLTEQEIKAAFEADPDAYRRAEAARFEYLVADFEQSAQVEKVLFSELKAYYEKHLDAYRGPEGRPQPIGEVLDKLAEAVRREKGEETARRRIQEAEELIRKDAELSLGEVAGKAKLGQVQVTEFLTKAALAEQQSLDDESGEITGLAEKIFSLGPGATSPVLASDRAVFLVRLKERRPAAPAPLVDVRQEIRETLAQAQAAARAETEAKALLEKLKHAKTRPTAEEKFPWKGVVARNPMPYRAVTVLTARRVPPFGPSDPMFVAPQARQLLLEETQRWYPRWAQQLMMQITRAQWEVAQRRPNFAGACLQLSPGGLSRPVRESEDWGDSYLATLRYRKPPDEEQIEAALSFALRPFGALLSQQRELAWKAAILQRARGERP